MNDSSVFPEVWEYTTVGQVCETESGGTPDRDSPDYYEGEIPWMKSGEMTDGPVRSIEETITKKGLEESSASLFPEGTLVVALYGATSGKLGILQKPAATNQAICGIFPSGRVERDYLFWYLRHIRGKLLSRRKGGAQDNLSQTLIRETELPLPPLPEQRRIVAKIEELFSNLDAGRSDLATAEQQLERYRLSVLQAAVEGRLTADWRRTHAPEPADRLLERILVKRRDLWEEQYRWERYDSKGKEPPSGWKDRYSEPVEPDLDNPRELPEGWTWAGLNAIYEWSNGDALPQKDREDGPYPVYGGNGVAGEHNECMVEKEALVVGRVGANCGNVHLSDPKSWITDNAIYSKFKSPFVDHRFMVLQLRHKRLNQLAGGSGQPYLSQKKLNSVAVALPPLAEQKQIVGEVERLLSVADDAAATAEREQTRADRLRQSILKQAFSGRLVPHEKDAAPPQVDGSVSESSDSNSGEDADEDVEDLLGSTDPDKQIEMDL